MYFRRRRQGLDQTRRCVSDSLLAYRLETLKTKLNSVALVRERTIPTERPPPVGEDLRVEGCHVVSATGPHGR